MNQISKSTTWELFNRTANAIILDDDDPYIDDPVADDNNDDDNAKLEQDEFREELVDMSILHEPNLDAAAIPDQAIISHQSMAMGLVRSDNTLCEVFESMQSIALRAQTDVESETAGRLGATSEQFAKIW